MTYNIIISALMCAIFITGCDKSEISDLNYNQVPFSSLPGFDSDNLKEAEKTLQRSCSVFMRAPNKNYPAPRNLNLSGKVRDFHPFCKALIMAEPHTNASLKKVLTTHLMPYRITHGKDAKAQVTGYYEPLLHGSRKRHGKYQTPLYRYSNKTNLKYSRAQIVKGALRGKKLEMVWVDDPIDAFFLQIQGSGRVQLDSGETIRIGYAGTNKHAYHPIGKTLIDNGALAREKVSMQSIRQWLKSHPKQAEKVMSTNESYVFFKEIQVSDGPIGSQGVELTPRRSLAVDPHYIGLGTPLWVNLSHPTAQRRMQHLAVAQDTGGAIKGGLRADYFWGFGKQEATYAGLMNSEGYLYALLPKQ